MTTGPNGWPPAKGAYASEAGCGNRAAGVRLRQYAANRHNPTKNDSDSAPANSREPNTDTTADADGGAHRATPGDHAHQ